MTRLIHSGTPRGAILCALIATTLTACGGGGGSDETSAGPTPQPPLSQGGQPPASASASASGFVDFAGALTALVGDLLIAFDLNGFTPPVDAPDDTQPVPTANDAPSKAG